MQLAPASIAHHHAGLGGLATHTLDVIERALKHRQAYSLPLNAPPEVIAQQKHLWTYAIFAGALLHDIGKMTTTTVIEFSNGKSWNAHQGDILESGAKVYRIRFDQNPYKFHSQIANSYFHLLPAQGRSWLSEATAIYVELAAWLYGDIYEFGTIGEIIRTADGQSVAANLKIGGERQRLSNAPDIPLVEKLMTGLRTIADSNDLKINGKSGASGWCKDQFVYLVCGTVADKVRSHLSKSGATGIPADNTRLFDVWQEHGYVVPTESNEAIWTIKVDDKFKLTVLKFETNRIFHPSRRPAEYEGDITIIQNVGANTKPEEIEAKAGSQNIEANTKPRADPEKSQTSESNPSIFTETVKAETNQVEELAQISEESSPFDQATENKDIPTHVNNIDMDQDHSEPEIFKSELPENFDMSDPDIAKHFLTWVQEGLRERKLKVNSAEAIVHVVKEGVALVSPRAFKKFIWDNDLTSEQYDVNKGLARIQSKLEKMMKSKKVHRVTKSGLNIHRYKINGAEKTAKIQVWLVPAKFIFTDLRSMPSPNPVFENLSGFPGADE